MAKRKQYVYMVNATKKVCGNLQSAIENAMDDMYKAEQKVMNWVQLPAQLSAPIVTKTWGGYQVVAVGYNGTIRKRRIDVFEPSKQPRGGCKQYKVDRSYAMHYEY